MDTLEVSNIRVGGAQPADVLQQGLGRVVPVPDINKQKTNNGRGRGDGLWRAQHLGYNFHTSANVQTIHRLLTGHLGGTHTPPSMHPPSTGVRAPQYTSLHSSAQRQAVVIIQFQTATLCGTVPGASTSDGKPDAQRVQTAQDQTRPDKTKGGSLEAKGISLVITHSRPPKRVSIPIAY